MDPILQAHALRLGVYSLGDRLPLSIRDQMVRAHYLIERLLENQIIKEHSSLLVVGAGLAGTTAAVLAARHGVNVLLIDSQPSSFSVQSGCKSRWIDPVQYDWPALHFSAGRWPTKGPDPLVPFGFSAGYASRLVKTWITQLTMQRTLLDPNLKVWFESNLADPPPTFNGSKVEASIDRKIPLPHVKEEFEAVILARGVIRERTTAPLDHRDPKAGIFQGRAFWEEDDFQATDLGISSPSAHVYISGSGDGALQDFIRLVTGCDTAREVLEIALDATPSPGRGFKDILLRAELCGSDEQCSRALFWSTETLADHDILLRAHKAHWEIINNWITRWSEQWDKTVDRLYKRTVRRHPERIHLVHSCNHFSACYPLNRFVTLVLATYIEHKFNGSRPLIPMSVVRSVSPKMLGNTPSHACSKGCWDNEHTIGIEEGGVNCWDERTKPIGLVVPFEAQGVAVRHGIETHVNSRLPRDPLPFHL